MKVWYLPSFFGDFRLVEDPVDKNASELLIMQPTPNELQLLGVFLKTAVKKRWTEETIQPNESISTRTIKLAAPITQVGPVLVKVVKPKDRTLTAVSFKDGRLEVAETGGLETLVAKASNDEAKAAVSVARPTPCCPQCEPGSIGPAREVLQAFMTPQEHEDWAKHRAIMVVGGLSQHRYLLAHRHSRTAVLNGKICYDLDDHCILHFHQTEVPPEEEILAAKLILEHREPWLRNEATTLQQDRKTGDWFSLRIAHYKNPFGDAGDGRVDAAMTAAFGAYLELAYRLVKKVVNARA